MKEAYYKEKAHSEKITTRVVNKQIITTKQQQ